VSSFEADRVVEAGGLHREFARPAHAFGTIEEPPGRAELQGRIVAGERGEFAGLNTVSSSVKRMTVMPCSCRQHRAVASAPAHNPCPPEYRRRYRCQNARRAGDCGCDRSRGGICITSPSSRLMRAISVSICARRVRHPRERPARRGRGRTGLRLPRVPISAVRALAWPWSVEGWRPAT